MFINKTFLLGNTQKRKKTGRLLLFGKFPVSRLSQSVSLVLQFLSLRNLFGARDALKQKPRQRLSTYGKFPSIRSIPFFSSSSMKGSVLDKSVEVFNVKSTGIWICDKTKYKETRLRHRIKRLDQEASIKRQRNMHVTPFNIFPFCKEIFERTSCASDIRISRCESKFRDWSWDLMVQSVVHELETYCRVKRRKRGAERPSDTLKSVDGTRAGGWPRIVRETPGSRRSINVTATWFPRGNTPEPEQTGRQAFLLVGRVASRSAQLILRGWILHSTLADGEPRRCACRPTISTDR